MALAQAVRRAARGASRPPAEETRPNCLTGRGTGHDAPLVEAHMRAGAAAALVRSRPRAAVAAARWERNRELDALATLRSIASVGRCCSFIHLHAFACIRGTAV